MTDIRSGMEHIRSILTRSGFRSDAYRNALDRLNSEWRCGHDRTELRVKVDSTGRKMYAYQCLRCGGKGNGAWVSPSAVSDKATLVPMDEELPRRFLEEKSEARESLVASFMGGRDDGDDWWQAYNAYTASSEWRARRDKVLKRANYLCEGCGNRPATQVHHLTYDHVGDELLWELRAVCDGCHAKVHPHLRDTA